MSSRNPPRIATWLMEHLTTAERDEAIAGDLEEEFRGGRSTAWYWRQALAALAREWCRSVWRRREAMLFAAIWSLLSPAWRLEFLRHFRNGRLDDILWRLPFPWSTICAFALGAGGDMVFIWLGVLVYVALCRFAFAKLHLRCFGRALLASFAAYAIAGTCVIAVTLTLSPASNGLAVDWRTLTLTGVLSDITVWTAIGYLPFFVGTASALWILASNSRRRVKVAA